MTSEQLALLVGYDIQQISKSLEPGEPDHPRVRGHQWEGHARHSGAGALPLLPFASYLSLVSRSPERHKGFEVSVQDTEPDVQSET